ncbi:glycylpeptide N-tetradecanoyltransferase 2-like isoform X2 [Zophobas morio]|uniref:glycylpeptide N-tetradecanoyltransferase 2-like isoform X2 n=1 Tax=Zophobas morio TaxID=2755281 RepID=UPI003083AD55
MVKLSRQLLSRTWSILLLQARPRTFEQAIKKEYTFWSQQPVVKLGEVVSTFGQIEDNKGVVSSLPIKVNENFEWSELDVLDPLQLDELHSLLAENYVEDLDRKFRLDYSKPLLLWALTPPNWKAQWHVGLRARTASRKLVAFISAVPVVLRVGPQSKVSAVEINFLCVTRKIRKKQAAVVLIKEITRRVHLEGIFVAAYTAGTYLPSPVSSCRYWHRTLNCRLMVEVGFTDLPTYQTLKDMIHMFRLPAATSTVGLRPLQEHDCKKALSLLRDYLFQRTTVHPVQTLDDFKHWFLPREGVVYSYVVESPRSKSITGFMSFYMLNSRVIDHPKHKEIRAAYIYYVVAGKNNLLVLMKDLLILAKKLDVDVVNGLDVMDNGKVFRDLKFGKGDANLHYYLYNYRSPPTRPENIGLVFL